MATKFSSHDSSDSGARPSGRQDANTADKDAVASCSQRVIILGASNVTMSLQRLVTALRTCIPQENRLDLFVACGHGRSYGKSSRVLVRTLPGIIKSGLWEKLESLEAGATAENASRPKALITDIGNDLIYGVAPETLCGWIETCIERLNKLNAEIVMTGIPLSSLERLSPLRYKLTQKIFFPDKTSTREGTLAKATELHERLGKLAEKNRISFVPQPLDWFGFDPIHFRHRQRANVWKTLCSNWTGLDCDCADWHAPFFRRHLKWNWRPAEQLLFGKSSGATQPYHDAEDLKVYLY